MHAVVVRTLFCEISCLLKCCVSGLYVIVLEGCISQYIRVLYWRDACHYTRLFYWRNASHNTLDYCIGGMHLTIH